MDDFRVTTKLLRLHTQQVFMLFKYVVEFTFVVLIVNKMKKHNQEKLKKTAWKVKTVP